jgi:hypothetical protein
LRAKKTENKTLMNAMVQTATKVLSKIFYDDKLKKELFETLFKEIVSDHKINDEYSCRSAITKAAEEDSKLIIPQYFETFEESGDLEQDLILRTKWFFQSQSNDEVKKCAEYVINQKDTKDYDQIKTKLQSEIKNILGPYRIQVTNTAHELITSIISVHRELASKDLYKKLNRED